MFAPKSQSGTRTQQSQSSRGGRHTSKSRCEASVPLNGWAQGDRPEQDIYYLAIDSWAKRNAKIKPDAPKGVPSSKVWEPFLCTTIDKCSSIPDYEAFTQVSLCLHTQTQTDENDTDQPEQTSTPSSEDATTKKAEARMDDGKDGTYGEKPTTEEVSNREESKQENGGVSDNSATPRSESSAERVQDGRSTRISNTDMITHGPTPMEGEVEENGGSDVDRNNERVNRQNNSRSAPVSRTQQRETNPRRGTSAKTRTSKSVSFSADDKLRRSAMRKLNKSATPQKVLVQPNPVKISYSHASTPQAGIFAGNLPMNVIIDKVNSNQLEHDLEAARNGDKINGRTSAERRLLIEEALKDSKKVEYIPRTAHVSIGDLLSSTPRLERRLGAGGHSRDFISAAMMKDDDERSSPTDTFGGWPTTQQNNGGDAGASPTNDSSLPPVPVGITNSNVARDVHTSPSTSQGDPRKPTVRSAVHLKSAKIPVISYTKGQRREPHDVEEDVDQSKEMTSDPEDTRYIKYTESIMNAIHETTVELDSDLTNVPTQTTTTPPASKSGGNKNGNKAKHRGPPPFRPQHFKTPLQRAVENAHKKIYGQHYYLFSNNSGQQGNEGAEESRPPEVITGQVLNHQRTQSAKSDVTSAYVWKENIESQIRYKRNANLTSTRRTGETNDTTPKTNTQRNSRSSVVDHYTKNSKLSGLEKNRRKNGNGNNGYTLSDFRPNFGKSGAMKTDRGKVVQR